MIVRGGSDISGLTHLARGMVTMIKPTARYLPLRISARFLVKYSNDPLRARFGELDESSQEWRHLSEDLGAARLTE